MMALEFGSSTVLLSSKAQNFESLIGRVVTILGVVHQTKTGGKVAVNVPQATSSNIIPVH